MYLLFVKRLRAATATAPQCRGATAHAVVDQSSLSCVILFHHSLSVAVGFHISVIHSIVICGLLASLFRAVIFLLVLFFVFALVITWQASIPLAIKVKITPTSEGVLIIMLMVAS